MDRTEQLTERLRREHGEAAASAALRLSWDARIQGAADKSERLLAAAIRLCRPA